MRNSKPTDFRTRAHIGGLDDVETIVVVNQAVIVDVAAQDRNDAFRMPLGEQSLASDEPAVHRHLVNKLEACFAQI